MCIRDRIVGLIYGFLFLSNEPQTNFESWCNPKNLENVKNFIAVGFMHNFSYFGVVLGLIVRIFYSYKMRKQNLNLIFINRNGL